MIARFTRGSARSALAISLATLPIAVPSMAYAQEGATAAGGVGDIVVTAMRREQRIQDVPVSISAFGGESIEKRQAVQISLR